MGFEQINQPDAERNPNTQEKHSTAASLRNGAEKTISLLCKNFSIDGQENLDAIRKIQNEQADSHFVITSSHLSNLDGAGAIKAFGDDFDLQMAVDSTHFGFTPQEVMYRMAGKENFTAVEYKKVKGGKIGVFNPDNFSALTEKSEQGKTPWIALSGLSITGKMLEAKIGPAYLAQKTKSYIIPSALEVREGGSISLEGLKEMARGLTKKAEVVYHIGKPIKLEPVNVKILEDVLAKRKRHEKPTHEELLEFSGVVDKLRVQTEVIARAISDMLPENMRGEYAEKHPQS